MTRRNLTITFSFFFLSLFMGLQAQNNALDFNGTSDYVHFPTSSDFNFDNTFTLECWVKTSDATLGGLIVKASHVGGTANSWGLQYYGDGRATLYLQTNVSTRIDLVGGNITDGNWHHVAGVKDGNTAYLYVDGELVHSLPWPGGSVVTTYPVMIGRYYSTYDGHYTDGIIDEVRMWNVARSQAEIQAAMNTELSGSESGLVAYYNFNQGTACSDNTGLTTLTDVLGNNDGTLAGFDLTGGLSDPCESNWTNDAPMAGGEAVPTMGEWALIIFGLMMASLGTITVMRWQREQKIVREAMA